MFYLRYLCLFAYSGVQHILCCVLFFIYVASFSGLSIFIATSVISNFYLLSTTFSIYIIITIDNCLCQKQSPGWKYQHMTPGEYDLIPHCHHCYIVTYIALYCRLLSICIGWLGWLNELGIGLSSNSYKPITNTAWVRAWLCKLQKNDALDLQPQVIRFTSCLPMVGGSLRHSGFFHHKNWSP